MNTKMLSFIALTLVVMLNACSPFTITSVSGEQPTPVVEYDSRAPGYKIVQVHQVEAEVGFGSPIPVQVNVSGSLPDTCAQVELMQQEQVGSHFKITLSTVPSNAEGCVQDTLPFRIALPLNIVNLPAGPYSVDVNGSFATFEVDTANKTSSQPTADSVLTKDDILVDSVNVEIGVGSPIPVHAIVGLSLANTCAQLGEVRLHRDGNAFNVRLIAHAAERADCQADHVSIPFRADIPLNIVNLPEGPYQVNVNGVTASFDPRAKPTEAPTAALPTVTAEASVPSGWETHSNPRFNYSLSYPPGMEGADSGDYSWTLGMKLANPDEGARNFVYLSVIPAGFQSSGGDIYNYNTAEADVLLNMLAGESKSLREGLDTVDGFTYTRKPDTILSGQAARQYENTKPWEFPEGTKEIRYYVQTEAYTYLLGGYIDTTGSNQPGAITEALFNQIAATFRVMP